MGSGTITAGIGSLKKITTRGTLTTKFVTINGVSQNLTASTSDYGSFKPAKSDGQASIILKDGVSYNIRSITNTATNFLIQVNPQVTASDNIFTSVTISRLDGAELYSGTSTLTLNEANASVTTESTGGDDPACTNYNWGSQNIGTVGNSDGDQIVYKFTV